MELEMVMREGPAERDPLTKSESLASDFEGMDIRVENGLRSHPYSANTRVFFAILLVEGHHGYLKSHREATFYKIARNVANYCFGQLNNIQENRRGSIV
jgi:hypothetical protein